MGLLLFAMIAGGVAGFAAWAICEPSNPGLSGDLLAWQRWGTLYAIMVGGFIGGAIGAVNGWYQGSKLHLVRGLAMGAAIGVPGGLIGMQIAGSMFELIAGRGSMGAGLPLGQLILARTIAFIPFGAMIGFAIGASGLSWKRAWVGALGGAVGGLLSGMTFDVISNAVAPLTIAAKGGFQNIGADGIPQIQAETGGPGRAATSVVIGCLIGLFTALFARMTRSAWLRLHLGRNEGKEWIVDAPATFLGRSEKAHVPLFGDPNVAPMHARIERHGPQYILVDGGSPIGTYVNGARVSQIPLHEGAMIQIGPFHLTFLMKAGAAYRAAEAMRSAPAQPPSAMPNAAADPNRTFVAMPAPAASAGQTQAMPAVPLPSAPGVPRELVALEGPLTGQRFPLQPMMDIGREGGSLPLAFDTMLSRRHASIAVAGGSVQLTDLGSTNGTYVNGQRVQQASLRLGDRVTLGSTTFRVE